MKRMSLSFIALASLFISGSCLAEDVTVNRSESFCTIDVARRLQIGCCRTKTKWTKQKSCFASYLPKFKGLKYHLGTGMFPSFRSEVVRLRSDRGPRCELDLIDDLDAIKIDKCVNLDKIYSNINKSCCSKEYKDERQECLKKVEKDFKKAKKYIDPKILRLIKKNINTKKKAKSCGAGGKEYSAGCQVMERLDGYGGFLHKYPSDHGDIALLLPAQYSASACGYVTTSGKPLFGLRYDRRTNPNRQTWRGGSCAAFGGNRPVYARCNIGGVKHCWLLNNPCTRND